VIVAVSIGGAKIAVGMVIRESCRFVPAKHTESALASLGGESNLVEAARVWHHRFAPQGGCVAH
jgi:hypothetical protein